MARPIAGKTFPLTRLIELRKNGLSFEEIAAIADCAWQNVQQRLNRLDIQPGDSMPKRVTLLEACMDGVLASVLESVARGELEDVPIKDRIVSYAVLVDKYQALTGRGKDHAGNTVNISLSFPGNQVPDSQGCVIDITDQSAPAPVPAPAIAASPTADDATLDVKVDW
jgi:hypothetical protein